MNEIRCNTTQRKVVIFGNGQLAEIADWYLRDSLFMEYEVCAFTVDFAYIKEDVFQCKPVVPFEHVEDFYPPVEYLMLVMASYTEVNALRKRKYLEAKEKGYSFATFVHPNVDTRVAQIGENVFIFEDNTIQPFVKIGNNCILWSGNHIGHHTTIRDHVFISSHVVVSGSCEIGECAFLGVNATLRDNVKVGEGCVVGAGALILHDTEPDSVHIGHEAILGRKKSYELKGL